MRGSFRQIAALSACQRGAAAVEFAIISLVMILVCLALLDVGRVLLVRNELAYAADHAARMIMRLGECSETEVLEEAGRNFHNSGEALQVQLSSELDQSVDYCTVTVRLSLRPLFPALMGKGINLSAYRRVPLV